MTALSRTNGHSLFDSPVAFDKGRARLGKPADGLRALQKSLSEGRAGAGRDTSLPDLIQAGGVQRPASGVRPLNSIPAAFSVVRTEPDAISISSLATAASARSSGFSSLDDEVTAGTLNLSVNGTAYGVAIAQGATLKDVVGSIRGLGAGIQADVESNGSQLFLTIKNRNTGYSVSGAPDDALTISETSSGTTGQRLGASIDHVASNAVFSINGVSLVRTTNLITDAVPGTTVDLAAVAAGTSSVPRGSVFQPAQARSSGPSTNYLVMVDSLAEAAEVRSAVFGSQNQQVKSGTFSLNVEGKRFDIAISDGDTLAQVRQRIEDTGAGVKAAIVNDSGGVRLSITSRQSGYRQTGRPEDALSVSEVSTGSGGQSLSASLSRAAANAVVRVNGVATTSRSNSITGAVPGFTLSLKQLSPGGEMISLPTAGPRPGISVENEVNRVLQAQLLNARGIAPAEEDRLTQAKRRAEAPDKNEATLKSPTGGTESSRQDILRKLTAVDDIFGGLRSAQRFLAQVSSDSPRSANAE